MASFPDIQSELLSVTFSPVTVYSFLSIALADRITTNTTSGFPLAADIKAPCKIMTNYPENTTSSKVFFNFGSRIFCVFLLRLLLLTRCTPGDNKTQLLEVSTISH